MRSWFAAALALALMALGPVAGVAAHAEETTEPTPSAEATASASEKPAKDDDEAPAPSASAKEPSSPKATPTVAASDTPKPSAKPSSSARAAQPAVAPECAATPSIEVAPSAPLGGKLRVSGAGFCHPTDGGSRIAIKIDEGAFSRLDTSVHGNATIWAIVDAGPDGTFSEDLQLPDGTTAGTNGTSPAFTLGAHTLRLLTGSLKTGDQLRTLQSGEFQATDPNLPSPTPTSASPTATSSPTVTPTSSPTPTTSPSETPSPTAPPACVPATAPATVSIAGSAAELGGTLRVTGSGFCHPTDGGSRIAIKIDAGGFSRLTTELHANKTIWAIVDASATDGSFDVQLQLPDGTEAGANGSFPAFTAGAHTLQLLTGSLKTVGEVRDTQRTLQSEEFTVTAPSPTPTPTPTPSETPTPTPTPTETPSPTPTPTPTPSETPTPTPTPTETPTPTPSPGPSQTYTDPNDSSVTYTVPTSVQRGEPIVVSGTGWRAPVGVGTGGSVLGVLLDAAVSGDPNTVYTKRDVINPLTGLVHADKRQQAIVQASSDGSWTATIPFPTADNARLSDGSWNEWTVGSTHQIRFLTGSLLAGDRARSLPATFTVTGTEPVDPATQPPAWAHTTVTAGGATAWVQSEVATASGSTIKVKGTNWTNQAGTGASTVALKLNRAGGQYARTGSGVVAPGGTSDPTIWKLLAPAGTPGHPNVVTIPASGNFEIEVDAPAGLVAGQLLTVQFLSGRFGANDTVRNVTSDALVVGGVPYVETPDETDVTCTPTSGTPVVTIVNPRVSLGGTIRVTGTGFCHPGEKRGGSTIAIKIDEGAFSRLNDAIHSNRTIWTIVQAKASDGTFDVELQLPDGTTAGANGSSPAFTTGAHTLRLLTGSLKEGDTSRTLQSSEFVVGSYRPNGVPDPVEATEDLTEATRNGVTLSLTSSTLQVTVPGAKQGDWIYLNAYSGGSPRDTWGQTWFVADAEGRVKASIKGITLPAGTSKVTVQSGNEGRFGTLLGWATLTVATPAPAPEPPAATPPPADSSSEADDTDDSSAAPTTVPKAPVERGSQLTGLSNGDATAKADGTKVTVTLPKGAANQWVYVYLYSGASVTEAGWVRLNSAKAFAVDLKDLADGRHRIVAVNADGDIVGWVEASKGNPAATVTGAAPGAGPAAPAGPADPAAALTQPGGGSLEPVLIGAAIAVLTAGVVGLRRLSLTPKRVK